MLGHAVRNTLHIGMFMGESSQATDDWKGRETPIHTHSPAQTLLATAQCCSFPLARKKPQLKVRREWETCNAMMWRRRLGNKCK